ncbi:flagellar hook protein FlgE [Parendozoicomonas sp. Alg238-R29]|uniref:flagellar hook protein FlgE n=1 Tax=Parendozoicomonas sp. Alg238-R29 TaxID=2993446 RepID=UPI00248DCF74|nr:flagellar hook protein FlgE [Parendozoicomonas sp. Alg238-R29]
MSYIGLSGLQMAKSGLETSSHNIANVETSGYKLFRNILSDSYAQTSGSNVEMSGVRVSAMEQMFSQGALKLTGNSFDLAIEGKGFFTLNNDGSQLFSRSGYFRLDKDGYVVNQDGYKLQGFLPGADGTISAASRGDLKSGASNIKGSATDAVSASINLDANDEVTGNWATSFTIYDSLGAQHHLGVKFTKDATSSWSGAYKLDDATTYTNFSTNAADPDYMNLVFDSTGALDPGTGDAQATIALAPGNGAAAMNVNLDFSSITQYADDFSVSNINKNGQESGTLNQVTVGDEGILEALYSNGERQRLGQVMVATFPSTVGLTVYGNNCWTESLSSGEPMFNLSGEGGAGQVKGGALEQSNVDITEELLNLVMEQRNYQVNARSIKTEDTMSQTLINQL